ncbi:hypothetical protein [Peribacillus sp. TH14]|nr:hypothetical protein [Peribacillus sp. TH14]MBK5500151.1 hypothetical protein [Peribacillus sp. TH14]
MFHERALSEISATAIFLASNGAVAITGKEILALQAECNYWGVSPI